MKLETRRFPRDPGGEWQLVRGSIAPGGICEYEYSRPAQRTPHPQKTPFRPGRTRVRLAVGGTTCSFLGNLARAINANRVTAVRCPWSGT